MMSQGYAPFSPPLSPLQVCQGVGEDSEAADTPSRYTNTHVMGHVSSVSQFTRIIVKHICPVGMSRLQVCPRVGEDSEAAGALD
jgi:hypothetical protein